MSEWLDEKDLPQSSSNRGYFTEKVIEDFKDNPGKYKKVPVGLSTVDAFIKSERGTGFERKTVNKGSEKRTSKSGKDYTVTNYDVYVSFQG